MDVPFEKAKELFNSVVPIPLGSDASAELCRYFQIRKAWDLRRYSSVTDADLIFRNEAKSLFVDQRFEHHYRGWKAGRITRNDIRQEFGGASCPINSKNLLRRVLRRTCMALGLPLISWHSFRHTHATQLAEVGESLRTAQALLGHSDLETTLNVYTHAIPESQKRAVDKVAGLLFPSVPQFSAGTENGSAN
ncbi:MAG TPA: tyrosine-type recombinase/integrase [Candidatus Acidoferrum sp.]|nr:tyrosine-type recombinase/integrase [Candidatus Acidoferrum sp.]